MTRRADGGKSAFTDDAPDTRSCAFWGGQCWSGSPITWRYVRSFFFFLVLPARDVAERARFNVGGLHRSTI